LFPKIAILIQGFDARVANRLFLVFALLLGNLALRVLGHCPHFGTLDKDELKEEKEKSKSGQAERVVRWLP